VLSVFVFAQSFACAFAGIPSKCIPPVKLISWIARKQGPYAAVDLALFSALTAEPRSVLSAAQSVAGNHSVITATSITSQIHAYSRLHRATVQPGLMRTLHTHNEGSSNQEGSVEESWLIPHECFREEREARERSTIQ